MNKNQTLESFVSSDGHLYVFEGPNSVGKTTLSHAVYEKLLQQGIDSEIYSFPGKGEGTIGKLIYELHHNLDKYEINCITPASLQMLHVAAHVDVIENKIIPSIKNGKTVILDRFWWSTIVYGTMQKIDRNLLNAILNPEFIVWGDVVPTNIFLVSRENPFEYPVTKEWTEVKSNYEKLANSQRDFHNITRLDNGRDLEAVITEVLKVINIDTQNKE